MCDLEEDSRTEHTDTQHQCYTLLSYLVESVGLAEDEHVFDSIGSDRLSLSPDKSLTILTIQGLTLLTSVRSRPCYYISTFNICTQYSYDGVMVQRLEWLLRPRVQSASVFFFPCTIYLCLTYSLLTCYLLAVSSYRLRRMLARSCVYLSKCMVVSSRYLSMCTEAPPITHDGVRIERVCVHHSVFSGPPLIPSTLPGFSRPSSARSTAVQAPDFIL